jgi:hypothetical protein
MSHPARTFPVVEAPSTSGSRAELAVASALVAGGMQVYSPTAA